MGDYLINDTIIERKSYSDLQTSIISKRIFFQLEEIKQYPHYILIVEDKKENQRNFIHENAMRGFLISCLLRKIPIIQTKSEQETADYLSIVAKRKQNKGFSFIPLKKSFPIEEQAVYILESFPNIGPIKAKKLIKKFHSLKNIINAEENQLLDILGSHSKNFLS